MIHKIDQIKHNKIQTVVNSNKRNHKKNKLNNNLNHNKRSKQLHLMSQRAQTQAQVVHQAM